MRWRRPSPRIGPPAVGRSPSWRRSARRPRPRSTRSPPSPTSPSARACGCTSTRRMPGRWPCCPIVEPRSTGWERADSIVINPHKWLFTPLDASLLLTRRMPVLRDAFSLVPEYLRTLDRDGAGARLQRVHAAARAAVPGAEAVDPAALVRAGRAASADRPTPRDGADVRRAGSTTIRTGSGWRPVPFSTVCFRWHPAGGRDRGRARRAQRGDHGRGQPRPARSFLSHTRLDGRFTIRVAIGNLRTEPRASRAGLGAPARGRRRRAAMSPTPTPRDVQYFASTDELRDWFDANHETADGAVARLPPQGDRPADRVLVARRSTRRCASAGSTACATASTTSAAPSASRPGARAATGARSTWPRSPSLTGRGPDAPGRARRVRGADAGAGPAIYSYERDAAAFTRRGDGPVPGGRGRVGRLGATAAVGYRKTATYWVTSAKRRRHASAPAGHAHREPRRRPQAGRA